MNAITIVLRSGMGMQLDSVRPYLKPGTPIAIGRGGSVIAEVAEGNAIEDKRLAAEAAAGYIDSVERYVENTNSLEGTVTALESALVAIERLAAEGQAEPWAALRRIQEITAVFLDHSGARAERGSPASGAAAEPAYPGAAAARRQVLPGEPPHSAPVVPLKPGIFDVITGTVGATSSGPSVQLPSPEEHMAQIERVAAELRKDQTELAESLQVLSSWIDRVEVEDGYVSVPVIEAVEVLVREMNRQLGIEKQRAGGDA